jgi:uncharacterized protein (UPF0218 family)
LRALLSYTLPWDNRVDFQVAWGPVLTERGLRRFLDSVGMAVCVGDYVSRLCHEALPNGVYVAIVDGATRRGERLLGPPPADVKLRLANPRGSILVEAYSLVCKVVSSPPARRVLLEVDGEEDLLALPAADCSDMPVVYGLPGVGSVVLPPGPLRRVRAGSALLSLKPGVTGAGGLQP